MLSILIQLIENIINDLNDIIEKGPKLEVEEIENNKETKMYENVCF